MALIGTDISKAKKILEAGGLVAIPTETVYGLAANALNTHAVARIFAAKDRPHFDPLIVHIADAGHASRYAHTIAENAQRLMENLWPGPLTLLLDRRENIPDIVTSGMDRVGLRCPNHPLTLELLRALSFPLAAPSANPFGYISPTTAQHVNDQLGDRIDYILDGGPCPVGIESTIVGFEDAQPFIFRSGGVTQEIIEALIGPVFMIDNGSDSPQSPGQLKSHYAPRKRLVLGNIANLITTFKEQSIGILSWKKQWAEVNPALQIILSASGDLEEAARGLFTALRALDQMDIQIIIAEEVPEVGLGKAINDRLRRAAALED